MTYSSPRRASPSRQTLPGIADLLNGPPPRESAKSTTSRSEGAYSASPKEQHRYANDHASYERQPLPTPPSDDGRRSYDNPPHSIRSGQAQDPYYPPPNSAAWRSTSGPYHTQHASPANGMNESAYTSSARQRPYDSRVDSRGSNLPPQSMHHGAASQYPPPHGYHTAPASGRGASSQMPYTSSPYGPASPHAYGTAGSVMHGSAHGTPSGYPHHHHPSSRSDSGHSYPPHSPTEYGSAYSMQGYDSEERPTRRRRGNLPKWATDLLKQWFFEHVAHPYPTEQEKQELCKMTGLGMTQLSNWFINARRRQAPALAAQQHAETMIRQSSGRSGSRGGEL